MSRAPELLEGLAGVDERAAQPCCFIAAHPGPLHDDGPTMLVEWLTDENILARGPRSWVCGTQAVLAIQYGRGRLAVS